MVCLFPFRKLDLRDSPGIGRASRAILLAAKLARSFLAFDQGQAAPTKTNGVQ